MEIKLLTLLYDDFLKLFIHFGAATKLAFGGKSNSFAQLFLVRSHR